MNPDAVTFVPETPHSLSCFDGHPPTPSPRGDPHPWCRGCRGHRRLLLLPLVSLTAHSVHLTFPQRESSKKCVSGNHKGQGWMSNQRQGPSHPVGSLGPLIWALLWVGSARSHDERLVTRCLMPPLLFALSNIQLFDQLVTALARVRAFGHSSGPLCFLLFVLTHWTVSASGMPVCRRFEKKQDWGIGRVASRAAWRQRAAGRCLCRVTCKET